MVKKGSRLVFLESKAYKNENEIIAIGIQTVALLKGIPPSKL